MLIEYLVFDWTYRFSADKNITDHISFAGTIVGIILAVVAIFYSFIQAESQNRSSTEIATQIVSLRDVVKDIDLSKLKFSDELNRMSEIAKKLDALDLHVGESKTTLSSMHAEMLNLAFQIANLTGCSKTPRCLRLFVADDVQTSPTFPLWHVETGFQAVSLPLWGLLPAFRRSAGRLRPMSQTIASRTALPSGSGCNKRK
ncbi:hypothetical protein VX159_03895 [Dechloromonas sp. ZY10]|uniref:hypothetical protein n=1 Tax=Dechloromonas aquae TaxID=2664436 RepID=UPI003528E0A0